MAASSSESSGRVGARGLHCSSAASRSACSRRRASAFFFLAALSFARCAFARWTLFFPGPARAAGSTAKLSAAASARRWSYIPTCRRLGHRIGSARQREPLTLPLCPVLPVLWSWSRLEVGVDYLPVGTASSGASRSCSQQLRVVPSWSRALRRSQVTDAHNNTRGATRTRQM